MYLSVSNAGSCSDHSSKRRPLLTARSTASSAAHSALRVVEAADSWANDARLPNGTNRGRRRQERDDGTLSFNQVFTEASA